ncbi:MAG: hypothetical protein DRN01_02450 [Thermoplasmata archaeon]|nr:MAG: hypothetical protein DRN01_02450 [Thermoplasmata archaeon]
MNRLINEMRRVIAFVFRRAGVEEMKKSEFYLALSMHLRWCTVDEAKGFLSNAVNRGLLEEKNGYVKPVFSLDDVEIPLDFKPSSDVFVFKKDEVEQRDIDFLLSQLLETGDSEQVFSEIERIMEEKQVIREVAVLFFAHKKGFDVSEYVEDVFRLVRSEALKVE